MQDGQWQTLFDTVGNFQIASFVNKSWPVAGVTRKSTGDNTLLSINQNAIDQLVSGGNVVGGIIAPGLNTEKLILGVAGLIAGSPVLEIGKIPQKNGLITPIATVTTKLTNAFSVANVNPFTGEVVAATTYLMNDVDTIAATQKGQQNQVQTNVGGTANDVSELIVDITEAAVYYVIWVTQSTSTRILVAALQKSLRFPGNL